ncbi:RHS repeat-associated core domain-containing protein [Planctomycetota bacterium]
MLEESTKAGPPLYYYHTNALGNVMTLTDSSGIVKERYKYEAYGALTVVTNDANIDNLYFFTARRYDPETEKYYYRVRYYDPEHGRFINHDPVGGDYFGNLYAYCSNDPENSVDPYGLKAQGGCVIIEEENSHWEYRARSGKYDGMYADHTSVYATFAFVDISVEAKVAGVGTTTTFFYQRITITCIDEANGTCGIERSYSGYTSASGGDEINKYNNKEIGSPTGLSGLDFILEINDDKIGDTYTINYVKFGVGGVTHVWTYSVIDAEGMQDLEDLGPVSTVPKEKYEDKNHLFFRNMTDNDETLNKMTKGVFKCVPCGSTATPSGNDED